MKSQLETCPSVNGFSHNIFYSSIAAILNFNFRLATFLCNNCYLFVFQEQKNTMWDTEQSQCKAKPQLFTTFLCDQYHGSDLKSGRKKNPKTKLNELEMFFSKFYGKVGVISWLLFHQICKKNSVLH